MGFRLFGVNVEIQAGFWITALLLGLFGGGGSPRFLLTWVAVVLVSVLVHEYGHALAILRHRVEPEITLHWMGGSTTWRAVLPLRRRDHVIISLAGPVAGFLLAGAIYALTVLAPATVERLPGSVQGALEVLVWVNTWWGVFNLIPVVPLDGGHVLEHALGPKRARTAAMVSTVVGTACVLLFILRGQYMAAMIIAMGVANSYQRLRAEPSVAANAAAWRPPRPTEEPIPPDVALILRKARAALDGDDAERAIDLATQVVEGRIPASDEDAEPAVPPPRGVHAALQILGWAHILSGRPDQAADAVRRAKRVADVDPALIGAVAFARKDLREARRVLEAARAQGDDRKEVVGTLIQVLLEQREVMRAAAVAYDIVDQLSDEDARRMASIAFESGAFEWSARLREAVFGRDHVADDAYEAARALAKAGDPERALEALQRAVEAGFSDRERAWSDAALESLREHLETVLPRPESA